MPQDLFTSAPDLSGLLARVVLERGIDAPEGLTYSVPRSLADLAPGERVRAPLGRGDRPVLGWVLDVLPASSMADLPASARLKPLLGRAGKLAASSPQTLTPGLIKLATWISQYYCCPIGMTLKTMLPAAVKAQTGTATRTVLTRLPQTAADPQVVAALSAKVAKAWQAATALPETSFPVEPKALAALLSARTRREINQLVAAGLLVAQQEAHIRARGHLAGAPEDVPRDQPKALTPAQRGAVDAVSASLGTFASFLLQGVTGSGKTEVYLQAIAQARARGESAIVLVPEISLTPQTASRFLARFGPGTVAVLHSGLTASQRHLEWSRVARGEATIVVGARSAIFAPMKARLGLIVVDEEHDHSYKQDQLPRYHARDVALRRGQLESCPVLLGSATPSLESWHNAHPKPEGAGRSTLLCLPDRVGGGELPPVEIVDLAQDARDRQGHGLHAISVRLEHELGTTLARGGQAILLLNRRGFASYICCADATCGWYMTCTHCDVTVVYHRGPATTDDGLSPRSSRNAPPPRVCCHHCLAEQKLPEVCPACAKAVNLFGFGTQRLERELERLFPQLRADDTLLRLDADTMRTSSDYSHALGSFRDGHARVLLGTQMIAKGLDFPGVELIGVINADTALSLPDFRAAERTFQLVSQVAGRAGRGPESGRVARAIIQTLNPQEPAIVCAAHHDFPGFAQGELALRREAGLPPYGRMARIVCRDEDPAKAEARAGEIASALREALAHESAEPVCLIKGPMPCPIARIAGQHRFAVELLAPGAAQIQRVLTTLRGQGLVRSDAHTAVDVDPLSLQ